MDRRGALALLGGLWAAGCAPLAGEGTTPTVTGRDITINGVEVSTAGANFAGGAAERSGELASDLDSALQAGLYNRIDDRAEYRMLVDVRRVALDADETGTLGADIRYVGPDGETVVSRSVEAQTTAGYQGLLIEFATAVRTRA